MIDNKIIKYLIHYDIDRNNGRSYAPAATNKADYIVKTLNNNGYFVEIISAIMTSSENYLKNDKININDKVVLTLLPACRSVNIFEKIISRIWRFWGLFFYLIFNIKKDEEIIIYHSLALISSVSLAKKVKKFKLILEVEEIYNDVLMQSERKRQKEIRFIQLADKYIFPIELLNDKLNKNKPYTIIHGTYQVEEDRKVSFNDNKIHVVYAGTFDPRKGGGGAAAAAEFLDSRYHIHILGFGSENDKKKMLKTIEDVSKKSKATLTYDGLLSGEDYIRFIQSCHIGLSTQNPNAEFNDTSFPSKVLSYMANGLRVVSIKIKALQTSAVDDLLYYYDEDTPEAIASAIKSVDINVEYDSRDRIKELNEKFIEDMKKILWLVQ